MLHFFLEGGMHLIVKGCREKYAFQFVVYLGGVLNSLSDSSRLPNCQKDKYILPPRSCQKTKGVVIWAAIAPIPRELSI